MNKLSTFLSLKIFKIRKPIELVLFDKLFYKFITNLKNASNTILEFHKNGFVKINPNISEEVDIINNNLEMDNSQKEPPYKFRINKKVDEAIKKIINIKIKKEIQELETYFNSKIFPAMVHLRRNTYYKKIDASQEYYSDNFHNDAYVLTHFKIFFNLMDVRESNGPMHIISKRNTEKFFKKINYKDRSNYKQNIFDSDLLYSNTGQKCETLIFDPTQCLHRATIPTEGNYRDYLTITFVCLPKDKPITNELINKTDIYKYENNSLLRFVKPHGLRSTFKLLSLYL